MIKIYNINWIFKWILWDELKDFSTFSAQENWWNWKLSLSIKYEKDLINFEIWDIVKYYQKNILLFSGNITEIEQDENVEFNFYQLNVVWIAHFIANYKHNQNYNDTLLNITNNLITAYNSERWQNILSLWILPTDSNTYNIAIWEKNFLDYFKELSKLSKFNFFINELWNVNFKEQNNHTLIFGWEIESIKNIKTDPNLIAENKIFNSIWIIVNNQYNYYEIKPLDKIKILNNNKYKEIYTVAKIQYWKEKSVIELENFISFTKLLWN